MSTIVGQALRRGACCVLVVLGVVAGAPAVAQAGVSLSAGLTLPPSVTVGSAANPASVSVTNLSANGSGESGFDTDTFVLTSLTAVLSCGTTAVTDDCPFGAKDGGVIVPGATAAGRPGTACAGVAFTISQVGAAEDAKYAFLPATQVVLGASSGLSGARECFADFFVSVARAPAIDSSPCPCPSGTPGLQTSTSGYAAISDNTAGPNAGQGGSALSTGLVTVAPAQPSIATQASPNTVLGAGLTDQATVSGLVNPVSGPGAGTVEFRVYGPDDATCVSATATFTGVALTVVASTGTATSPPFMPTLPGTYRWRAFYSGDGSNAPVSGACNAPNEDTAVNVAQPTLSTQASSSVALGGGSLTDQATVSGLVNPVSGAGAGTVQFRLYGPNDATCATAIATFSGIALALNGAQTQGTATSPPFTPPAVGTYRWRAFYSGDAHNQAISAPCDAPDESTVVFVPVSAIQTVASPGITLGGGTLTDQATVSGLVNAVAGTVEFRVYGPDDATCATVTQAFPGVALALNAGLTGGTATSPPFTPAAAGTYRWRAFYSGDANNLPASGPCNAANESATVSPVATPPPPPQQRGTPFVTTVASAGVALGGQVTDTATVTGRVNPVAGSTVEFRLYGPDDTACSTPPAFTSTVAVSATGTATSAPFTPTVAGTYRWRAFYSGDVNNNAASGVCNAPGERVIVTAPDGPIITRAAFAATPRAGAIVRLSVTAVDPTRPIAGMRVRFGEPRGLVGISGCDASSNVLARRTVTQTLLYTFRQAGAHSVEVTVLSGGCSGPQHQATTTIEVTVAGRTSTRRASAIGCKDRSLTPTAATRPRIAAAILCLVNVERRQRGRQRLVRAPRLARAAAAHATDMARRAYFAHERTPGGPGLITRLRKAGYRGSADAENIAYASDATAMTMVQAWMSSPPQRANILNRRLKFAAVGVAIGIPDTPARPGSTYTMDFGATLR